MPRQAITTDKAPKPGGHFAQAIAVEASGRLVFISGMVAQRPDGTIAGIGDIEAQTRQVCENVKAAVEAAGGTLANVCRVDVYVRNIAIRSRARQEQKHGDELLRRRGGCSGVRSDGSRRPGLWMAHFYPWPEGDGQGVYVGSACVGTAIMAVSIVLGIVNAVRRGRDIEAHGDLMIRAYAIGLGAGTQVLDSPALVHFCRASPARRRGRR